MYAVISTGGKQYKVAEGDTVAVEKLDIKPGDTVGLNVLFIADGSQIAVGEDTVSKAKVYAEVLEHFRGVKTLSFKFKKRKGYKKIRGHRQELTRLRVRSISPTGENPLEKKEDEKKALKAVKPGKAAASKAETKVAESEIAVKSEVKLEVKPARKAVEKKAVEAGPLDEQKEVKAKKPATKKTVDEKATAEIKPKAEKKPTAEKKPAAEKKAESAKKATALSAEKKTKKEAKAE